MQYKVSHVTKYTYDNRVPIGYNRVCLTPRRCPYQECLRATLDDARAAATLAVRSR
jgi:hypothetical protein